MTIKVVEYVHEYDDTGYDFPKGNISEYPTRARDTYYAVGTGGLWDETDREGNWINGWQNYSHQHSEQETFVFGINGSDLRIHDRNELLGFLGLLNKLLEEFPEETK